MTVKSNTLKLKLHSFYMHTVSVDYTPKAFNHKRTITKNQYDVKTSKQRIDTIVDGNVVQSELFLRNPLYNFTVIYTLYDDGECRCVNVGPSDSSVFIQCETLPILEKGIIGGMNGLKIGFLNNNSDSNWAVDDYYWVVPSKQAGYWWFVTHEGYSVNDKINYVGTDSTTFYNQVESVDMNDFFIPKYCPRENDCPNVRK
ncbi:hypothetical protein ABK040_001659 [Willaertia magna]